MSTDPENPADVAAEANGSPSASLMTAEQVADALRVAVGDGGGWPVPATVRNWAHQGCPHARFGRRMLFDLAAVRQWAADAAQAAQAPPPPPPPPAPRPARIRRGNGRLPGVVDRDEIPPDVMASLWEKFPRSMAASAQVERERRQQRRRA